MKNKTQMTMWKIKNKKMVVTKKWNEEETKILIKKFEEEIEDVFDLSFKKQDTIIFKTCYIKIFLDDVLENITNNFYWDMDEFHNIYIWDRKMDGDK